MKLFCCLLLAISCFSDQWQWPFNRDPEKGQVIQSDMTQCSVGGTSLSCGSISFTCTDSTKLAKDTQDNSGIVISGPKCTSASLPNTGDQALDRYQRFSLNFRFFLVVPRFFQDFYYYTILEFEVYNQSNAIRSLAIEVSGYNRVFYLRTCAININYRDIFRCSENKIVVPRSMWIDINWKYNFTYGYHVTEYILYNPDFSDQFHTVFSDYNYTLFNVNQTSDIVLAGQSVSNNPIFVANRFQFFNNFHNIYELDHPDTGQSPLIHFSATNNVYLPKLFCNAACTVGCSLPYDRDGCLQSTPCDMDCPLCDMNNNLCYTECTTSNNRQQKVYDRWRNTCICPSNPVNSMCLNSCANIITSGCDNRCNSKCYKTGNNQFCNDCNPSGFNLIKTQFCSEIVTCDCDSNTAAYQSGMEYICAYSSLCSPRCSGGKCVTQNDYTKCLGGCNYASSNIVSVSNGDQTFSCVCAPQTILDTIDPNLCYYINENCHNHCGGKCMIKNDDTKCLDNCMSKTVNFLSSCSSRICTCQCQPGFYDTDNNGICLTTTCHNRCADKCYSSNDYTVCYKGCNPSNINTYAAKNSLYDDAVQCLCLPGSYESPSKDNVCIFNENCSVFCNGNCMAQNDPTKCIACSSIINSQAILNSDGTYTCGCIPDTQLNDKNTACIYSSNCGSLCSGYCYGINDNSNCYDSCITDNSGHLVSTYFPDGHASCSCITGMHLASYNPHLCVYSSGCHPLCKSECTELNDNTRCANGCININYVIQLGTECICQDGFVFDTSSKACFGIIRQNEYRTIPIEWIIGISCAAGIVFLLAMAFILWRTLRVSDTDIKNQIYREVFEKKIFKEEHKIEDLKEK